jgi:uncharacterized membrane protein YdjX (TVP38/TMEM64 family)
MVSAYFVFFSGGKEGLREKILSYKRFAPGIYIILLATAMMTAFTGSAPLIILSGAIFGKYYAFIYSIIGAELATNAAYFIGRVFGTDVAWRLFPEDKLRRVERAISREISLPMLIVLRAIPHPLYDVVNYACGFARVPFVKYVIGTAIGLLPAGVVLCFLGEEIFQRYLSLFVAVWILMYAVMVLRFIKIFRRN